MKNDVRLTMVAMMTAVMLPLQMVQANEAHESRLTPSSPGWTRPSAMFAFMFMIIVLPLQIISMILLIRRRGKYPIAGRGWVHLLVVCITDTIGIAVLGPIGLFFTGLPCAIDFMISALATPVVIVYSIRYLNITTRNSCIFS